MKKTLILSMAAIMTLGSCNTYTSSGAYMGSSLGSILGSAIGGITGGPRGSDVGTLVGIAGGAIVGAAIGSSADKQRSDDLAQYRADKAERVAARQQRQSQQYQNQYQGSATGDTYGVTANSLTDNGAYTDDPAYVDNTNSGDDRLYDFNSSDYTGNYSAQPSTTTLPATSSVENLTEGLSYTPHIEIRNARIVDDNQDNVISRGELCKVIFEVFNTGQVALYDIQPTVVESTGNRHIFISPGMHVERLLPGAGIRYTAMLKADDRLTDGNIRICASVVQGEKAISKVTEFNVPTRKKSIAEEGRK